MDPGDARRMGWIFLALAALLAWVALTPRLRSSCQWGRTDTGVPVSGAGFAAWIGAFLLVSGVVFGLLPFVVVFFTVPLLAVAGLYDFHRHSRRRIAPPPHQPPAQTRDKPS